MLGTIVLAALVAGVLKLLGVTEHNLLLAIAGVVFASAVWLPATRQWSARAHLCWASSVFLFVVYLTYALDWTLTDHLGAASTIGAVVAGSSSRNWTIFVYGLTYACPVTSTAGAWLTPRPRMKRPL